MSALLDKIYQHSPVWLQNLGINAYGWYWSRRRLGAVFERTWREYAERESWPVERMQQFVETQLREQLVRALREVPHYREAFRQHGLGGEDLARLHTEDLSRLPLLEKSFIRANPKALLRETLQTRPPAAFHTSGTTGTPLQVYWDSAVHQRNIAVREARSYRWAGVSIRQPRSVIGGRMVVPHAHAKPPYWRYNRWEKQLYMSAFHISPGNVPDYVTALNRFKPVTMTGYASANFFLARLVGELGLEVHSPRAIITGSEKLEPHMRATLESAFRTRVYEEYGSVENCALATECERGRMHVHPDFGWVEVLDTSGNPARPGEVGELVLTGFVNTNQIFIRYRIGDLAALSAEKCPCGRDSLPVLQDLVGRLEDTVVGPDGREMVRFHGLFVGIPGVVEGQVIQSATDQLTIKLVPSSVFSYDDKEAINQRIIKRLGPGIEVRFELVEMIPRQANGKFRAVISNVKRSPALEQVPSKLE